jgi:hypothetical protein
MHKTQSKDFAQPKRGFAMTTTDLRPLTHAIQDAQADGWRVGSPDWVAPADLRADEESAREMVCGGCGSEGLLATFLHHAAKRRYRLLCVCWSCGFSEE